MSSETFWRLHDWFWRIWDWFWRLVGWSGLIAGSTVGGVTGATTIWFDGWDPAIVLPLMLVASAAAIWAYVGLCKLWDRNDRAEATAPTIIAATAQPDINASVAFFDILAYSEWSKRQKPETDHPVSDWLVRRLDGEIHNQLHQGKLTAWGHRCLDPFKESPEGKIPSKEWAKIEIDFSPVARTSAIWRIKKSGFNVAYAGVRFCSQQIYGAFPLREELSLFEACVRAFECTRNNDISILAQGLTDSSKEEILSWYCNRMCKHQNGNAPLMKLWGTTPPSREKMKSTWRCTVGTTLLSRAKRLSCNNVKANRATKI